MPDPERTAYTTRELEHGARVHHDAVELLSNTSDLLANTAEELHPDHADDYVHLVRVSRRLSSIALLLAGGEQSLRRLQDDRPYRMFQLRLSGIVALALGLTTVLQAIGMFWPGITESTADTLQRVASGMAGIAFGVSGARYLLARHIRPTRDRS